MKIKFGEIIFAASIVCATLSFSGVLEAADDAHQHAQTNQMAPNLTEEQRKVSELLGEAKKKVDALVRERNELMQKNAPPEQIQAKTAQVMQAQKDAMESLKKNFPQGLPPLPGMNMPPQGPPKLSQSEQAELDKMILERKQMVMNGAKFEDIESMTKKIQEKYYGKQSIPPVVPKPPAALINQNQAQPSGGPAEAKST